MVSGPPDGPLGMRRIAGARERVIGLDDLLHEPVPDDIAKLDRRNPDLGVMGQYQEQLLTLVKPQTDAAEQLWNLALDTAKSKGVSNEWSKLAATRLNTYIDITKYPVQRQEVIERETNP